MGEDGQRTALLVEDDPDLRPELRRCLEEIGFDVVEVGSGRLAVDVLGRVAPAIVVLDLMLPELSGLEVCEYIRRTPELKRVPVLITSARGMPQDRAQAEEAGADAYLVKPFSKDELIDAVRRLVWPKIRRLRPPPRR